MFKKVNVQKTNDSKHHRSPWMVRWREPGGKRPKRCFPTKTMANMFAAQISTEINAPLFKQTVPKQWQDLLDKFLAAKKAEGLANSSIYLFKLTTKQFADACGGKVPISNQITIKHIDQFKQSFTSKVSAATVNCRLRMLSSIMEWAVIRGYLPENPVPKSGKLREKKKVKKIWTPQQFAKVMDVVDNDQWRLFIHLGIHGVARRESIRRLTVSAIDFSDGTILAYDAKQKTERVTPLHPATIKLLTDYVNNLPNGQEKLFTSAFHHRTWDRYILLAKVPHVTFHDLRTCMSTWLKQAGVSGDVVTAIFGHSSTDLTYKHYTALDDVEIKRAALNKLPL